MPALSTASSGLVQRDFGLECFSANSSSDLFGTEPAFAFAKYAKYQSGRPAVRALTERINFGRINYYVI